MQTEKQRFRHESLQDTQTIQKLLKSLTKGIAKGKLTFSDEGGKITMSPEGLLDLKLTASKEEGRNRVNIRISWQQQEDKPKENKTLSVK